MESYPMYHPAEDDVRDPLRAVDTATLDPRVVEDSLEFLGEQLSPEDQASLEIALPLSPVIHLILDETALPIAAFGVLKHGTLEAGVVWRIGGEDLSAQMLAYLDCRFQESAREVFPVLWRLVPDLEQP